MPLRKSELGSGLLRGVLVGLAGVRALLAALPVRPLDADLDLVSTGVRLSGTVRDCCTGKLPKVLGVVAVAGTCLFMTAV